MPILIVETEIAAPPEVCFDLVRDISLHVQTTKQTGEKAILGRTHGKIKLGETVTFEGKHFGIRQRLTVKVTAFERPRSFTDEMIEGNFKLFKHKHEFIEKASGTLMRDTLEWTSPFGILGKIVDAVLLENHLRELVSRRNAELKKVAENLSPQRGKDAEKS
ncbi:MAG TPA: SRPBCC family protein [Pyrinomonadaceae bacterium]|nr:SRPBCC family protein [Pyrinomonadaceae bacterium]